MRNFFEIVHVRRIFLSEAELHLFEPKIPAVQPIAGGCNPFVQEREIINTIAYDPPDELLSLEVVLVVPEGHACVGDDTANSLLTLTEGEGEDGHAFVEEAEAGWSDSSKFCKLMAKNSNMRGQSPKSNNLPPLLTETKGM